MSEETMTLTLTLPKRYVTEAMEITQAIANEREACAQVLDEMANDMEREMEPSTAIAYVRSKAAAIRARGASMTKNAIAHYESALKEAFPSGATGDVFHHWNEARKALAEQPAQQEPVARSDAYYMIDRFLQNNLNSDADYAEYSKALDSIYTTPPQRKPLTSAEIRKWWASENGFEDCVMAKVDDFEQVVRAIEAKLKEKST